VKNGKNKPLNCKRMTKVITLNENNSIFCSYLSEIRDVTVQGDSMRFRRNMERMGELMAYEISKTMEFEQKTVTTPLGEAEVNVLAHQPVVASILRAGLPLHTGLTNAFDRAENAFVSAYRKHSSAEDFVVEIEYLSGPSLEDKILILADPMLATGSSMVLAYQALIQKGKPKHIHIVSVIASSEGVEFTKQKLPANTTIWCGAIDSELTAQAYIVPGLGDAGDLAFGVKE